ncbi:HNH endonuclease [Lichenibacterium minor]|uniref:HNH endonuclease n=2 Tax=Lichenibacterium minor TaxID=2316528 RepID=A0A4Q2U5L5_9HYPH|nr:HNH endonuclease [Lichenibacterium minor]
MRMRYGTTYALADFCDRLVPKSGEIDRELLKETFDGLRRLAQVQSGNPWMTLHATTSAGVWINYRGFPYCLINPAKSFLRIGAAYKHADAAHKLKVFIEAELHQDSVEEIEGDDLQQWRIHPAALSKFWTFFEKLECPSPSELETMAGRHPRFFSSEDRVTALEEFEKAGRFCPGVGGKTLRHKLEPGEPIEFDHIIPHSRGGASTYWNLSILCAACNRLKAATAA